MGAINPTTLTTAPVNTPVPGVDPTKTQAPVDPALPNGPANTTPAKPVEPTFHTQQDCFRPRPVQPACVRPQQPVMPQPGCLPPPAVDLSGPPAGRGLTTGENGWPKETVTTAGGYHVVPQGGTNWSIYAPGQASTDTANTRVWGDPHIAEKDGTNWDFTKSSDFVLGDGTRIFARTSAETGQSVTVGLDIVNGADRIAISDVNTQPKLSPITQDGYEWRAAHVASDPNRDTFYLKGDQNNVHWLRERNQHLDGVVTGAAFDAATKQYQQTTDGNVNVGIDPSLRPPLGSRAWGNLVRGAIDDQQAKQFANLGNAFGAPQLGQAAALQGAQGIHADHNRAAYAADVRDFYNSLQQFFPYFGLFNQGLFNNYQQPFDALSALRSLLLSSNNWTRQYQYGFAGTYGI